MDLFREKHTPQSVGHLRRWEAPKYGVVSFYGLGNFIGLMSERIIPTILGKGWRFPGIGPPPTFWPFMVSLWAVMAPVGVSFSWCIILEWAYSEAHSLLEVEPPAILDLVGSNQFLLYPQGLCHSFKGCVLTPSLLFQSHLSVVSCYGSPSKAGLCMFFQSLFIP